VLVEFHLRNFILIEDARLTFTEGLNILSGETGAGKSLLATALGTVLGNHRFQTGQIRKGAKSASLTAIFELPAATLTALETELEMDLSTARQEGFILERTIPREGRGRSAVNGRVVPLATLRQIGERLLDMAAQDEHNALREPAQQRYYLDLFGGLHKPGQRLTTSCRRFLNLYEQLQGGTALRVEREKELKDLQSELEDLSAVQPDPQVDAELEGRLSLLENADRIQQFCATAIDQLYESDHSLSSALGQIVRDAEDLAETVPDLQEGAQNLQESLAGLDDAVRSLRGVLDAVDANPEELEEIRERLILLKELARHHHCDLTELATVQQTLQQRSDELSESLFDIKDLKPAVQAAADQYCQDSAAMTRARKKAAKKLITAIAKHLSRLGMEKAEVEIRYLPQLDDLSDLDRLASLASPYGLDEVQYFIRPNPGEDWGLLSTIASGGETTRIMLAVKSSLASVVPCDVLFFDEIDAGVGGRLGEAIADQLLELSTVRQVIAITHLPQIASRGNHHLCVRKETRNRRTFTEILKVVGEERVHEIACMIRGDKSNATTLTQAREMLASPSTFHENAKS
jgi:DNA repair protein RecN (Recombination protein N)